MAFLRSMLCFSVSRSLAVTTLLVALTGMAVVIGGSVGCVDGATPNCAGDAGCGPGIDAALDAVATASDSNASDSRKAVDASDATITGSDASADSADAGDGGDADDGGDAGDAGDAGSPDAVGPLDAAHDSRGGG